jgi:superfamily I DNA/RNA helicase
VLAQWDGRAATRTCASSRGSRAPTRSCAARTSRASSASCATRRRRRPRARGRRGGGGRRRSPLLTIHAAKGLEFKVVVVADAGRDKAPPASDEILALSDGRFGFRVADPITSERRGAYAYEEVKEARKAEERAERLRLYYVAMTRAIDRLIVSGSIDPERNGRREHADRLGDRRLAASEGDRA